MGNHAQYCNHPIFFLFLLQANIYREMFEWSLHPISAHENVTLIEPFSEGKYLLESE